MRLIPFAYPAYFCKQVTREAYPVLYGAQGINVLIGPMAIVCYKKYANKLLGRSKSRCCTVEILLNEGQLDITRHQKQDRAFRSVIRLMVDQLKRFPFPEELHISCVDSLTSKPAQREKRPTRRMLKSSPKSLFVGLSARLMLY